MVSTRPSGRHSALSPVKLASEVIAAVLNGRALSQALAGVPLSRLTASGRGLAQDVSYGVLRYKGTLEGVLAQLLKKPLDTIEAHALLLAALYQLAYTEAAPYAVVDNAVNAAPQRFKSLTNAVLRNFLRSRETLVEQARKSLAGQTNFPQWWIEKLQSAYPEAWERILQVSQQHPPMTLRVNRRQTSAENYLDELKKQNLPAHITGPDAITLDKPVAVEKLPGFAEGRASVQDAGAQWAARLLDVHDGMRVLDACAAPGGKTGHILELADAAVLALDVDDSRLARVRQNLDRLKLAAQISKGDAAQPEQWWNGRPFDRILADVPCSASGVVRRNPDIKWLRRAQDIEKFSRQQSLILDALWQTLAPGGKLLYATCSIFPEENTKQIEKFLSRHSDATRLELPEIKDEGQLLPDEDHDGFYYALLQRA